MWIQGVVVFFSSPPTKLVHQQRWGGALSTSLSEAHRLCWRFVRPASRQLFKSLYGVCCHTHHRFPWNGFEVEQRSSPPKTTTTSSTLLISINILILEIWRCSQKIHITIWELLVVLVVLVVAGLYMVVQR